MPYAWRFQALKGSRQNGTAQFCRSSQAVVATTVAPASTAWWAAIMAADRVVQATTSHTPESQNRHKASDSVLAAGSQTNGSSGSTSTEESKAVCPSGSMNTRRTPLPSGSSPRRRVQSSSTSPAATASVAWESKATSHGCSTSAG